MCTQFNPNPHELDFEMGLMPSSSPTPVHVVSHGQKEKIRAAVRNLMASPEVKAMTPAQLAVLKSQIRKLFARIQPHISR